MTCAPVSGSPVQRSCQQPGSCKNRNQITKMNSGMMDTRMSSATIITNSGRQAPQNQRMYPKKNVTQQPATNMKHSRPVCPAQGLTLNQNGATTEASMISGPVPPLVCCDMMCSLLAVHVRGLDALDEDLGRGLGQVVAIAFFSALDRGDQVLGAGAAGALE